MILYGANNDRISFGFTGGGSAYTMTNGAGTTIATFATGFTTGGLHVTITLTGADTFSATIGQAGATDVVTGTLGGTAGSGLTGVTVKDNDTSTGAAHDFFTNSMSEYTPTVIAAGTLATAATYSGGNSRIATLGSSVNFDGPAGGTVTNGNIGTLYNITFNGTASGANSNGTTNAASYTLTGNGGGSSVTLNGGVNNNSSNLQTLNSNLTLGANQTFNATNAALAFGGTIETNGKTLTVDGANNTTFGQMNNTPNTGTGLVKNGGGTLTLTGTADNLNQAATVNAGLLVLAKTNSGPGGAGAGVRALGSGLTIAGGTARLGGTGQGGSTTAVDQLYDNSSVTVTSGAFDLNDRSETINVLNLAGTGFSAGGALINSGSGSSTVTATGGIVLTANTSIGITVGGGVIQMVNPISGSYTLTKVGDGTLKLSGVSTYSGQTTVSAGTLSVNNTTGSGTGSGTVSVASTGTLGGTGIIGGATTISGNHTPGAVGIGNQTFSGALSYQSGSIFNWEIDVTGANSSSFDTVAANSLGGSAAIFKVLLDSGDNYSAAFWQQARTWSAFAVTTGSWNLSSIFSGFQYGNSTPDAVTQGSFSFTPNGQALQWTPVPEPANSLLAGMLLGAGVLRRSRGKRRGCITRAFGLRVSPPELRQKESLARPCGWISCLP